MGSWSKGTDYVYDAPASTREQKQIPSMQTLRSLITTQASMHVPRAIGMQMTDATKRAVIKKMVQFAVIAFVIFAILPFAILLIGFASMVNENGMRVTETGNSTIYSVETPMTAPLLTDYFTLPEGLRLDYKVTPTNALTRQAGETTTYNSTDNTELTQFSYEQLPSLLEFETNQERTIDRLETIRLVDLGARGNAYEQPLQIVAPRAIWVPVSGRDQSVQVLVAEYTYNQGRQKRHAAVVAFADTLESVYGIYDIPHAKWTASTVNDFTASLHLVTK